MRRAIALAVMISAAAGLAAAGYVTVTSGVAPARSPPVIAAEAPAEGAERRVLYYRHPDRPIYSHEPRRAEDGRPFRAVLAGEDVEPEDPSAPPAQVVIAATPQRGGTGQRRILYYRNPMGLPDISPTPRRDSMGMDYIPVYEGEEPEEGMVRVPPGRLQTTGVRSEPVVRREVIRPVRAPGVVQLDERRVSVISLRAEAFVERVEPVTTGERVTRGQPLLRIYSPEVTAAGAQYASALGIRDTSVTSDGARRRLENLAVPAEVIAEVERTRRSPLSFMLSSPRNGVVLERAVSDGMRAMPGDTLFRLADISVLWIVADVPERELGAMRPGLAAEVRPRALPGRSLAGRVSLIYPQVNMETRTGRLRVEIENPDGLLMPGMFAEVDIATGGEGPVIAVADSAVLDSGTRQVVILDRGEGRFEPREVRVGRRGSGTTEILAGVAEGDRVVVSANFLIDAESNLRAALRGLAAGSAANAGGVQTGGASR